MTGNVRQQQDVQTSGKQVTASSVARHLPGQSEPAQANETRPPRAPSRSPWFMILSALVVGVVAAGAMAVMRSSPPSSVDPPLTALQQQERTNLFQSHGALRLQAVAATERQAAIQSMALPDADAAALEKDVSQGQARLVYITLWDDVVEDGDVVEIIGGGFSKTVALTKARQRIAVPLPSSNTIQMRGVRDGGGGITVAAETERGHLAIPVMAPGQTLSIQISP